MRDRAIPSTRDFDEANWECAKIIEAEPLKFDGGLLLWAHMVLSRLSNEGFKPGGQKVRQPKRGQMKLLA